MNTIANIFILRVWGDAHQMEQGLDRLTET